MIHLGKSDNIFIQSTSDVHYTVTGAIITGVSESSMVLGQGIAKGRKQICTVEHPARIDYISVTAPEDSVVGIYVNGRNTHNKIYQATLPSGFTLVFSQFGWKIYDMDGFENVTVGIVSSVLTTGGVQTITNKRINKRVGSIVSSTNPTINTDLYDFFSITAQSENITGITLTGSPTEAQTLWVAITATGSKTLSWGEQFEPSSAPLPTSISTERIDVGFVYSQSSGKWRLTGVT